MTFLFRVEAGAGLGLGHLNRSLSLAAALKSLGADSRFVLNLRGGEFGAVERRGFPFVEVTVPPWSGEDAAFTCAEARRFGVDAVVVDSRNAPDLYMDWLTSSGLCVICRDDLGSRRLPCRVVLNGNADARRLPYDLARKETRFLLGPEYAVLPQEFRETPKREASPAVRNLLLVLGGTDSYNLMPELIKLCGDLPMDFSVTAVIGPFFRNRDEVLRAAGAARKPITTVENPKSLFDLMSRADLAISGGGQALYELACVGCPAIVLEVAPDQSGQMRALQAEGVIRIAGKAGDGDLLANVLKDLTQLINDPELRKTMGRRGSAWVDGQGANRVAQQFVKQALENRGP